jgi:spore germination cell wall hydrolase CwlJ-like protein
MFRRSRYRRRSILKDLWIELRYRWYTAPKATVAAVLSLGLVLAAIGAAVLAAVAAVEDRRQLACLARNVYYEARGEPRAGQYAVAEVTMNRVGAQTYPETVCGVVHQKTWDPQRQRWVAAFSWTAMGPWPEPRGREWEFARQVAGDVYYGRYTPQLDGATFYHAHYVRPGWSRQRPRVAQIGRHHFYQ